MEKIINDVADKPEDGKPLKLDEKKQIPHSISLEELQNEKKKSKKILDQI